MKKVILILTVITFLIGCGTSEKESIKATANTTFAIEGMTCADMCAKRIEDKIARMEGMKSCEVNFENELATLIYDEKKVDLDKLILKVEDMSDGKYTVSNIKTEKINHSSTETNSGGTEETGSILSGPSFEMPNIMEYLRNII